jgi:hypothetical protein
VGDNPVRASPTRRAEQPEFRDRLLLKLIKATVVAATDSHRQRAREGRDSRMVLLLSPQIVDRGGADVVYLSVPERHVQGRIV